MRQLLLDSHTLIWFFENDSRLPVEAKAFIEDSDNQIFISIASFWEIAIKKSLTKLSLKKSLAELFQECEDQQIEILPLSRQDLEIVETLPFHHRDPFDRLIVATCTNRSLEIVSADSQLDVYQVKRIW